MKKIAKGKPKKAAKRRKDLSRVDRAIRPHKEIREAGPLAKSVTLKKFKAMAAKAALTPIAKMKKVSLFLRPETIPRAHAKARKLKLSLTAYVAGLVEADLCKKAA